MSSFSGVLLLAGGAGITYALSNLRELVQEAREGVSNVIVLDFVWCIPHLGESPITESSKRESRSDRFTTEALYSLLPTLTTLLQDSIDSQTTLRIHVCYTRRKASEASMDTVDFPAGLFLLPGRPHLRTILEDVVYRICEIQPVDEERKGIFFGVCGPLPLGVSAREATNFISPEGRKRVGGIELHKE